MAILLNLVKLGRKKTAPRPPRAPMYDLLLAVRKRRMGYLGHVLRRPPDRVVRRSLVALVKGGTGLYYPEGAYSVTVKKKVWFHIALYPVRWTAQSALHFPPLADLFIPTPFSASLGSILAMQQLHNDYSLTFPPLSIARYSFIQLSRLRRREVKENAHTSKR